MRDASEPVAAPPVQTPAVIDPDNPPWTQPSWLGALTALMLWFGSVVCLVFVPLILVLPYLIYKLTSGSGQVVMANLESDKTVLFLSVLGVIPAHLVTFLLAYLVVTRRQYPLAKTLGLSWPPSWGPVKGSLICVAIAAALFGGGYFITKFIPGEKTQLDLLIESSYGARLATAFLAVATAPLIEEMVYRGILYPAIARFVEDVARIVYPAGANLLGSTAAIVAVSILFAGVHYIQYQKNLAVVGVITLVSITLTVVRAYTRRLLPCLVVHLVFNGIQAIIILIEPFLPKPPVSPEPVPGELFAFVFHLFF